MLARYSQGQPACRLYYCGGAWGEKGKVKSAHPFNLVCSRDKLYPPSLLYKDQSCSVFDFSMLLIFVKASHNSSRTSFHNFNHQRKKNLPRKTTFTCSSSSVILMHQMQHIVYWSNFTQNKEEVWRTHAQRWEQDPPSWTTRKWSRQ